jgi:hypothetical protein
MLEAAAGRASDCSNFFSDWLSRRLGCKKDIPSFCAVPFFFWRSVTALVIKRVLTKHLFFDFHSTSSSFVRKKKVRIYKNQFYYMFQGVKVHIRLGEYGQRARGARADRLPAWASMTRRLGRREAFKKRSVPLTKLVIQLSLSTFLRLICILLTWSRLLLPHGRIISSLPCQQLP